MGKLTNAILKNKAAGGTAPAAAPQQESKLRSAILQAKNPVEEKQREEERKVNSPSARSGLSRDEYDSKVRKQHQASAEIHESPATGWEIAGNALKTGLAHADDAFFGSLDWLEQNLITKPLGALLGNNELYKNGIFYGISDYYSDLAERDDQELAESLAGKGKAAQIAAELGVGAAAAAPQAILTLMSGGTSAAAQGTAALTGAARTGLGATISSAVTKMAKDPLYWSSFMQTLGPAYKEAKANGATEMQANATALISSLLNAGVETSGGIEVLPARLKGGDTNAILAWVMSMPEEGLEEVIQRMVSGTTEKAIYNHDKPIASFTDPEAIISPEMGKEFLMGAGVAGVLGGVQTGAIKAANAAVTGANNRLYGKLSMDQKTAAEAAQQTGDIQTPPQQETAQSGPETGGNQAAQQTASVQQTAQARNPAQEATQQPGNIPASPAPQTARSAPETGGNRVKVSQRRTADELAIEAQRIIGENDGRAAGEIIREGMAGEKTGYAYLHAEEISKKVSAGGELTWVDLYTQMELNEMAARETEYKAAADEGGQEAPDAVDWEQEQAVMAAPTETETAPAATEAAEAVSTEPAPVMAGQEGAEYAGKDRVSGDRGRRAGAAAGEPGRRVAQGTGRRQNREVQNIRGRSRADDVAFAYEHAGAEPVSTRDLYGDERGSEEANLREAPRSVIESDEELRGLAGEIRQAGYEPHFFTGMARLKSGQPCPAYFDGKRVFVRIDHPKWTATELWDHEKFHGIKDKDPGIVDRIWTQLAKTTDREQLQNALKVYRDRYHGAYDVDAEGDTVWNVDVMQKIVEEILADAYAGRDAFGTGVEDYTETVREMAGQTEEETAEARGPPEGRFALMEFEDGTRFVNVEVDQDMFDGLTVAQMNALAKKIIKERYSGNVVGIDNPVFVNGNSAEKHVYFAPKTEESIVEAKARASTELDNLIDAGRNFRTAPDGADGHVHPDAVGGFSYFDTIFKVGNEYYEGVVNIKNNGRGKLYHGVTKTKNITKDIHASYGENPQSIFLRDVSIKTVPQQKPEVKGGSFAVDAAEDTAETPKETPAQKLRREAEQYMPEGVTDRYRKEGAREKPEQPWWIGEDEEIRKAAEMMAERNRREPAFDVDEYLQRKRQEAEAERARRLRNVPKTEFEGTEAMNKLGIRVEGSVANYAAADQIRKRHSAARSIQKELRKAEKRLGATGTEQKYAKDIAGGVLTEEMLPTGVRQDVVMELADYYLAERAQGIDMIRQKRMEINQTLDEQMANLFKDTDKYDPSPIIVLNNRTPQRNMLKIFGDKLGQKINELIFDPVATNEAERIRFINRQLDQVKTFADSTGKQSRLNKDERALVQMMIEGRAVEEIVAGLEMSGAIQRLGKSIVEGADNGDGPQAVGLNGKERDLAKKYARWLQAQEALQSNSVDSVKVANAADKYSQLFDQYYDAINDFLVVHGYEPIGFIKGYAPHLQPEDNMDLLDKALKAIGVQRDIGNLPADIAGRTSEFKPNKRWNPYFLSRTGDETKYDIAEAFESYVDHLSDVLYHTDDIMRLRRMELFFRKNYSKTELGEKIDWAQHLREMKPEERLNALQDAGLVDTTTRLSPEDMAKVIEEYVEKNFAQMEDVTKYGEFVMWLQNYANILAGKQNMVDRAAEAGVGRKILGKLNRWLGLFAKSQVAGNISSALNQTSQLPMILAENGTRNTLQAARDMIKGDLRRAFADESDVLTGKAGIKFLVQTPGEMILDTMFTPAQWMDSMISSLAVRGAYLKAVKSGMSHEEAIKAADRYGRNVMGSREKGVKPIGFNEKNPLSKLLRVFQLEALNNWEHVSQDLPRDFRQIAEEHGKKKAAAALAGVIIKTLLSAFLLNRLTEETYGGTPAPFDFLGMSSNFIASGRGLSTNEWLMKVIDDGIEQLTGERSLGTERMDRSEFDTEAAFTDLGYNISNEIPFFGNVSALLGWGDKTLPWPHLRETGKELIEAVSENGFLSGSTAQAAAGVAGEVLPGGRQMVKTIGGIQSAVRGGKATGYGDDMALQFPTEQSPGNIARQVLFGVNATPEARSYWASGNSKLSVKQTQLWKRLKDGGADSEDVYDTIHAWREVTANKELDSLTRSALQRNMVRHMDMTDDQKLDMYRTLSGADSRCDKFQRMMDAGMTFDQVMDAYERHEELDNDESLKASDKAAQFVQWAYMELDRDAANAAITELAFYTTMKAAPSQAALEEQLNQTSLTNAQKAAIWDSYGWKKMSPWG